MSRARKPPPTLERLTEQLVNQAHACGLDAHLLLPPASAAMMMLGAGAQYQPILAGLARLADPVDALQSLFHTETACLPYLAGHLNELCSLLTHSDRALTTKAVSGMLDVLAGADLPNLVETPAVAGDLLGPLYTQITSKAARTARGAFYTPPSLAAVLAQLVDVEVGGSFGDPCCGTGRLAIAAVRGLRARGRFPEMIHWNLQDIDPLAVALAGVQLAAHGIPWVTLTCGNSLTDPAQPRQHSG